MSYVINVFIFCSQLCSIKNREEGENGRKSKDEIKEELFKSLIDNEIEFVWMNCKDTTTLFKEKSPRFDI